MKHFITFVFILLSYLSYGQITGTQVLAFQGNVTSTVRDGLDVPTGQYWMIYNTTTNQLEVSDDTDTWSALSAGGGGLASTDIDTYAELNAIVADVTLTHNGLFDTFAELDAIVADESLVNTNDTQTLTGKTIDANSNTLSNIGASELESTTVTPGSYTNTDLTVDADGRITAASNGTAGGFSGSIADTQVAFGTGADAIGGDADLTYNSTTNLLTAGGYFTSGNFEGRRIIYNTAGASTDEWVIQITNEENPEMLFYMHDGGYPGGSVTESYSLHVGNPTDPADIIKLEFLQAGLDDLAGVLDASAFSGNLATTDDTLQELADAVDGLSLGGAGSVDTFGTPADNQLAIFTDANTIEGSSLITFNGTTFTVDAPFELSQNQINNVTGVEWVYTTGSNEVQTGFSGGNDIFFLGGPNDASQALRYTFSTGEWFLPYDNSTSGLTANNVWAALDELAADVGAITPGTPPFSDTNSIVEGSADGTKELRIEVDGLTTSTTRVITMKDADIDLNNMVESKTAGLTGADQILNIVSGTSAEIDGWGADANRLDICTDCPGTSLFEADQTIATGVNRTVNSAGTATLTFEQDGTDLMRIGNNNDGAVFVTALEALSGNTIGLVSPAAMPVRNISSDDATTNDNGIIMDTNNNSPYISNSAVWVPMAGNSRVVTSATISMTGNVMYDDQTADAATITLNDCNAGDELTVYINRASAPTLAGTGLTFNQLPNTTAFAAATEMGIVFQVAYNGTTVDYYYFER